MSVQKLPIPVNGGYNPAAGPTEVAGDYYDCQDHRTLGGGLAARFGYEYASAFKLWDGVRNAKRHRLVTVDGGDFFHTTGGRGFVIVDGWDGHIVGMTMVPVGGIPFPADADGNPNPPHEFIGDESLIVRLSTGISVCDYAWTQSAATCTCSTATTAPVLRDGTNSADGTTYATFSLSNSVVAGNLAYYDTVYTIPSDHDCISGWLYWDTDVVGIMPASQFQFVIATSAGLSGSTNASIPCQLRPKRWTKFIIDLGDRGNFDYNGASVGLRLAATLSSSLFDSGNVVKLRLESLATGKRIRINRLTGNDTFWFNSVDGKTLFGNDRNSAFMWDGQDVMKASIIPPHLKPGVSLLSATDVSATVLAGPGVGTGTDVVAAGAPASGEWEADPQANFTATTKVMPTALQNIFTDGSTFVDVYASTDATDTNTNPVSAGGGNFLKVETTGIPTAVTTLCNSNINGTTGYALQDELEFEYYLDFWPLSTADPSKYFFFSTMIELQFYTGSLSGGAVSGNQIVSIPIAFTGSGAISAISTSIDSRGYRIDLGNIYGYTPANKESRLKRWSKTKLSGLSNLPNYGTAKSCQIVFVPMTGQNIDTSVILDASTGTWAIRLDTIKTYGAGYGGDAYYMAIDLIRNTGTAGQTTADAAIGTIAYKNIPTTSIDNNKAIQARLRWESTASPSGPMVAVPADTFRLQFNSNDTASGTDLTGGGDYGLIRTALRPNEWTNVTIAIPATGPDNIESMILKLEKKLDAALYTYGASAAAVNGTKFRLNITDIKIVALNSTTAATDLPTDYRVAFSWWDENRKRESGLSAFSDNINVPIGSTLQIEISGWRPGFDPAACNENPDPTRVTHVKVFVHTPIWGRNSRGLPRFVLYDKFPIPDGAVGSRFIPLVNNQNLNDVGDKPAETYDAKFAYGPIPACREAVTDGNRVFMATQAGYSVGEVGLKTGSCILKPYDAGGNETPEFDPYLLYHKMRINHPSVKSVEFTIFAIVKIDNVYTLLVSDRFDQDNNEWNFTTPIVGHATNWTSVHSKYVIYGETKKGYWTTVTSDGGGWAHPDSVGPFNEVPLILGAADKVESLHIPQEVIYAVGRTGLLALRQRNVFDDIPAMGPAYSEPQRSSASGILAPRSIVSEANGRTHWVGPEGSIMSGSVSGGFQRNPLSAAVQPFMSGETGHISTEGSKYTHGAFAESQGLLMFFMPEAD